MKRQFSPENTTVPHTEIDRLRWFYIAALGLVAVIALGGQIGIQYALRNDETNARIVNIAGQQRMVSQRLCKLALQISFVEQKPPELIIAEFQSTLALWKRSHNALLYGDTLLGIPQGKNSDSVRVMFARLVPIVMVMDSVCRRIALIAPDVHKRLEVQALTQALLQHSDDFLPKMNAIVFRYDEEFRLAVRGLERLNGALVGIILLVLLLEALLVFRPVVQYLRRALGGLEKANSELHYSNDMLVRQQAVLEDQTAELEVMNTQLQEKNLDLERHKNAMQEQMTELEKMYAEVQQARRVQSEFLANLSHELRTPMTAIIGFTEILLGDFIVAEGQVFGRRVLQSANILLVMLNDLIDFAHIESGYFQLHRDLLEIRPVLTEMSLLIQADAEAKGLSYSLRIAPEVPTMLVFDAGRIRQILFNLLNNAVKFTEKGAIEFRVSYLTPSSTLRFEIEDTGIGIPSEDIERVFEPFVQYDGSPTRKYGGIGVGLALVKRIVQMKGGTITLKSEFGKGTTVRVDLPREDIQSGTEEKIIAPNENIAF